MRYTVPFVTAVLMHACGAFALIALAHAYAGECVPVTSPDEGFTFEIDYAHASMTSEGVCVDDTATAVCSVDQVPVQPAEQWDSAAPPIQDEPRVHLGPPSGMPIGVPTNLCHPRTHHGSE
jgi:hypothetical protein